MRFDVNKDLLAQASNTLSNRKNLYWIVGGAGSGKSTISQAISVKFGIPIYDMDERIYGTYHSRFTQEKHPVNTTWSKSHNGLAWLLDMPWDDFNHFNQATIPEYLDLLCEDIISISPATQLLVDGGICNPTILAKAIPSNQILCLATLGRSSAKIWDETAERKAMQEIIFQLPNSKEAWRKFLEFDGKITHTILKECQESNITIVSRNATETVDELSERVAKVWGFC
ncbi:MAG TPA: hypothetical protein PK299_10425 [Anaerolineales bacterium]|nr:hypothetical protein [Anaerolineales bacterium]